MNYCDNAHFPVMRVVDGNQRAESLWHVVISAKWCPIENICLWNKNMFSMWTDSVGKITCMSMWSAPALRTHIRAHSKANWGHWWLIQTTAACQILTKKLPSSGSICWLTLIWTGVFHSLLCLKTTIRSVLLKDGVNHVTENSIFSLAQTPVLWI